MDLVKFINSLIDFGAIGDMVNPLLANLPFHFMPHPAVVHFALVLPVLALLFHLMALTTKNDTYRRASNYLFFLGVIAVLVTSLTGRLAGPDVAPLLSGEGRELFDEHMKLGYILATFYILLLVLKIISIVVKKGFFRVLMALLMIAGVSGLFIQAQHGGELVYKYAAGVEIPDDDFDDDEEDEEEEKEATKTPEPTTTETESSEESDDNKS
ncbi:MAG TPA: hypothetical protein EYG95_05215 [Campylobacterales bacterium]|nr:hypothetical protein [Campylobacterales bacterium]